jgi:hypothetical protein
VVAGGLVVAHKRVQVGYAFPVHLLACFERLFLDQIAFLFALNFEGFFIKS